MLLYTYWARRTLDYQAPDGRAYHLIAYAGSNESQAAAYAAAEAQLQQRRLRLKQGQALNHYPRGQAPLREPVEQLVKSPAGVLLGAVTRNRYGSRVLNTPRIMFLDVDRADLLRRLPRPVQDSALRRLLRRLLGQPEPVTVPVPSPEDYLVQQLRQWLREFPTWHFRVYRTRAGFRLLVTHAGLDPNGPEARRIFQFLPVDGVYAQLCRNQRCYRARLDPKPWRIGLARPAHAFTFDTPEQAAEQAQWEQAFAARRQQYSVCELVGGYGSGYVYPEAEPVLALHDEACLSGQRLA